MKYRPMAVGMCLVLRAATGQPGARYHPLEWPEESAIPGGGISPGTLYPMLHAMEQRGYLTSRMERAGRITRKLYRATEFGVQGLALATERVRAFIGEAVGGEAVGRPSPHGGSDE